MGKNYKLIETYAENNGLSSEEINNSIKNWFKNVLEHGEKIKMNAAEESNNSRFLKVREG